jgi:hypothetical protein
LGESVRGHFRLRSDSLYISALRYNASFNFASPEISSHPFSSEMRIGVPSNFRERKILVPHSGQYVGKRGLTQQSSWPQHGVWISLKWIRSLVIVDHQYDH